MVKKQILKLGYLCLNFSFATMIWYKLLNLFVPQPFVNNIGNDSKTYLILWEFTELAINDIMGIWENLNMDCVLENISISMLNFLRMRMMAAI